MAEQKEREAIATNLLTCVHKDDIGKVEFTMKQFADDSQWRQIVRWEFQVQELMSDLLQYEVTIRRLMAYEVNTLSPFHYAALKGLTDMVITFLDHDIPVDIALASGTTALHLAAFGGKKDCIKMLLDVYKADINKQDRYGWTALHYSSTEGHYDTVRLLIDEGITVNQRDQDGTSAAFRAQVNGYTDIVKLQCDKYPEMKLLNVQVKYDQAEEDIYSQVWTSNTIIKKRSNSTKSKAGTSSVDLADSLSEQKRRDTLPANFKDKEQRTSTIRRLIRKELESLDHESSGYMDPVGLTNTALFDNEDEKLALASIGANTLKGVIREELGRYTKRLFSQSGALPDIIPEDDPYQLGLAPEPPRIETKSRRNTDYEDIYETVKMLPPRTSDSTDSPTQPTIDPPPLPPRNATIAGMPEPEEDLNMFVLRRSSSSSDSMALTESIAKIAALVGKDWKKLAYALPLERNPNRIGDRVSNIEQKHPDNVGSQAATALTEWRINQGESADTDNLIIALRKCGLNALVEEVDKATQEFTA